MRARQEVTKSNQTFAWWHVVESAVSFPGKLCLVIWLQGNEGAGHCRKGTLLLLGNTMVNDKGKQNPTSWFIKAGQRLINSAWMHAQLFRSFPTLWDPMDCSLPRSSVCGISQTKILSGLSFPPPGDLSNPGVEPTSPVLAGRFFTTEPPGKPLKYHYSIIILTFHQN